MAGRRLVRAVEFSQYRTGECAVLESKGLIKLSMVVGASLIAIGGVAAAQAASSTAPAPTGPGVNDPAPDFSLNGADRYGLLKTPVKLSEYRGRTVVLAFFFQARTKG
jgi:hypothetical protein